MCWQQDIKPYVKSILKESFTCISIIECKHCCVCIQDIYIYMRSWLYFRCTALPCQILAPIPGWPVPQVAMPTCPWCVPMCPLPVQPIMNPTWVTLLHLIFPPGAPQKHASPPPPHTHTHLLFVCWFVHKVPLKLLCLVLKAAYLRQVKDLPDTVLRGGTMARSV